jgi:hypothetical protein
MHTPATQLRPLSQATPQLPQLAGSELGSMQIPPHSLVLPRQFMPQLPAEHTCPLRQTIEQAPQFVESI